MSRKSLIIGLITTAVLTVPFKYKKDENGNIKMRAVLYDLEIGKNEQGSKDVHINFGSFLSEQARAVKKMITDYRESRKNRDDDETIDADFEDLDFSDFNPEDYMI